VCAQEYVQVLVLLWIIPNKALSLGRGVVLTDLQSSIDCQKTSLSLSLSLSSVAVTQVRAGKRMIII
jgi:hypothetical protein